MDNEKIYNRIITKKKNNNNYKNHALKKKKFIFLLLFKKKDLEFIIHYVFFLPHEKKIQIITRLKKKKCK